ncbi:MAG: thiamine pyrophosphate-binding protein [Anaerolineales bacterium]|nr:thiamine pyrophosphate-binding protein [Anaerolineales bacterium]
MRAADLLIQALADAGIRHLFSLSGNQIMSIYDAWIDSGLELIHVRHEAAAVHMANAWGQLTGQPGVALVTAGPGFANTISALYDARQAESPLLLISGAAPYASDGLAPFQALDQAGMAATVCKASWRVTEPDEVATMVRRALDLSVSGRPGPVHLTIPVDILKAPAQTVVADVPEEQRRFDGAWVEQMIAAIRAARRPLLLLGPAEKRSTASHGLLRILRERGLPLIGLEDPRGSSEASLGTFARELAQADLVILLGKPLDFMLRAGDRSLLHSDARLLQFDADPEILALTRRQIPEERLLLQASANTFLVLNRLAAALSDEPPLTPGWATEVEKALSHRPDHWRTLSADPMHPAQLGYAIDAFLADKPNHLLIADGGDCTQWLRATIRAPRRLSNGPAGSIGGALPFALAARLARPGATIVACSGDGGFGFHPFELDTAVRYNLPFIFVIANDACWNAEQQVQRREFGPERVRGIHLLPTPYHEVAQALGAWGCLVEDAADLPAALEAAAAANRPAVINARIASVATPVYE